MNTATTIEKAQHACWICGSRGASQWKARNLDRPLTPEDFRITDSRYGITWSLWRCQTCSFIFADGDELTILESLYEQLEDPDYSEGAETRILQMRWLLDLGKQAHPKAKSLLEIGSGIGLLIGEAGKRGFDAIGVEPSKSLVQTAHRNGVQLVQGLFPHPSLAGRQFDLIYVVDVIEHVSDPVKLMRDCAASLAPGGVLVMVTPDIDSMASRMLKHRWWHLRLAHVGYFNSRSMKAAASAAGMKVTREERAKWFFSVSYLSERLAVYLPVGWFNRMAKSTPLLRSVYQTIIPLNLHDSTVFFIQRNTNG